MADKFIEEDPNAIVVIFLAPKTSKKKKKDEGKQRS